ALLHGFLGAPGLWSAVLDHWPAQLPVHAVALPGHAGRPIPRAWDDAVAALAAPAAAADLVIGYSLGARLALGLVAAGHARRAVLVSVNPGLTDPGERAARRAADHGWAERLRTDPAAFYRAWDTQPVLASRRHAPPAVHAALAAARATHDSFALAATLEATSLGAMPDLRAVLATHPAVELVVGAADPKMVALAAAAQAARPGLVVTTLAGAGHDLPAEAPAALAAALLASYRRLVGAAAPGITSP
ncbi:MAG: alpha/beta fold hydrolase, partial [Kofleriaceae bacterium]|nr:alpha/beta fold hydrolase [Kofleriaceae bacterium]